MKERRIEFTHAKTNPHNYEDSVSLSLLNELDEVTDIESIDLK